VTVISSRPVSSLVEVDAAAQAVPQTVAAMAAEIHVDTPDGALGNASDPSDNVVPDIELSLLNPILSASRLGVLGFRIAERG
jgi:hypothetical protein